MKLNRREFLGGAVLGTSILATGAPNRLLAGKDKPFLVVLDGITPSTAPERFLAAASEFLTRGIPACYAIDLRSDPGQGWQAGGPLADLLRRLSRAYPGLVELAVQVPGIMADKPYFRLRRASEAQDGLGLVLAGALADTDGQVPCLTLLTEEPPEAAGPLGGIRAAGFRNALFLPRRGGPRGFWQEETGVLQIHGGFEITDRMRVAAIAAAVSSEIEKEEPGVAYLAISGGRETGDEALSAAAATLGDAVAAETANGRIYTTLPTELHRQSGFDYARDVVLRIDGTAGDGSVPAGFPLLAAALVKAGIPFSYAGGFGNDIGASVEAPADAARAGIGICPMIEAGDLSSADLPRIIAERLQNAAPLWTSPATCVVVPSADAALAGKVGAAGASMLGTPCGSPAGPAGVDRYGLLRQPTTVCLDAPVTDANEVAAALAQATGIERDALVVVGADAIATRDSRDAIVAGLGRLARTPGNRLLNVEQFGQRVMPADAAFDLLKLTKSQVALAPAVPEAIAPAERAELIRDAEIAWRYFDRLTNDRTGLVPATTSLEGGLYTYQEATMWDVGSTLIGLVGA
ncbi:MAG: DUF3131 domain-containing protein, partial [Bauldia sp.]|nr:DUF3131 domain-containing protein [Bauldia sp.]